MNITIFCLEIEMARNYEAEGLHGYTSFVARRLKKKPFFHFTVTIVERLEMDVIERVGFFNPIARGKEERLRIDMDRVEHWRSLERKCLGVAQLMKESKAS